MARLKSKPSPRPSASANPNGVGIGFLRQPSLGPGQRRTRINGCAAIQKIAEWVEQEAERFHCSKSFVVAVALSKVSGIEVVDYRDERKRLRKEAGRG